MFQSKSGKVSALTGRWERRTLDRIRIKRFTSTRVWGNFHEYAMRKVGTISIYIWELWEGRMHLYKPKCSTSYHKIYLTLFCSNFSFVWAISSKWLACKRKVYIVVIFSTESLVTQRQFYHKSNPFSMINQNWSLLYWYFINLRLFAGWTQLGNSCYMVTSEWLSWNKSNILCSSAGCVHTNLICV